MKERGITMSEVMARAYDDGLKGETRRLFREQPIWLESAASRRRLKPGTLFLCPDMLPTSDQKNLVFGIQESVGARRFLGSKDFAEHFSPYGVPGDELYFREHWRTLAGADELPPSLLHENLAPIWYEASQNWSRSVDVEEELGKFRQGRFMCRWMSRFRHIPILEIKAQRLHEITEAEAENEGVDRWCPYSACDGTGLIHSGNTSLEPAECRCSSLNYREVYSHLWNHLHGPGSWDLNPFVWRIVFPKREVKK